MSDCIPFDIQKKIIKKVSNIKSLIRFRSQKNMPYIPLDIQMEIMKRLPVKPLIRFRSVSKLWKSCIDSSRFINSYGARHTQPHSRIISYRDTYYHPAEVKCISFVDDDDNNETLFKDAVSLVVSPLVKPFISYEKVIGACHGLLCLYGSCEHSNLLVIWNPSIRKSFSIVVPYDSDRHRKFYFGVCPVTNDPTVVKLSYPKDGMFWLVEVFTLSSGVWNVIPSGNWARTSVKFNGYNHVAIDRFIYWGAFEVTYADDGKYTQNHMLVSFDLITKEFRVLDLPDSITNERFKGVPLSVCKLRESLVVYGHILVEKAHCCGVWVMEHDLSFKKLFLIDTRVDKIFRFRKSGEPIFEVLEEYKDITTLKIYDPHSRQFKNLGFIGAKGSVFMSSYKESLLLLDHSDSQIYPDDN